MPINTENWNTEEIPTVTPCPKCGKNAEYLVVVRSATARYAVYLCPDCGDFRVQIN